MTVTVKKIYAEMTLFLLLILLLFAISSSDQRLSNCEFIFSYNGQSIVYNFSRLSRQKSWQTTNGTDKASISVCHPFDTLSQCQNSLLCVSGQQDKTWSLVMSNSGAYRLNAHSNLERPVLELVGMQPCSGSMNYSVEISFICSSAEQDPVLVAVRGNCTLLVKWETAAACPVGNDCVFGDSDFSSLRHFDYYEVETTARQKFLLNICGPVRSGACSDTSLVTACKVDENNKTIIGLLDGHHMELSKSTGLALIYTTLEKGVRTQIRFICNASAAFTSPKFLKLSGKTYLFEVETPVACKAWPQECMVLDRSDGHIDLSRLRKKNDNWVAQPSSLGVQYHINVCGPLNPMHTHKCADGVGACRTDSNSSISLGFMTSGLTITKSNTVILEYTGGSPCPSGGTHSMQIEFFCSKEIGVPVFMKETPSCEHHFSWKTMASCPSLLAVGENCIVQEKRYGYMFDLMALHSSRWDYSFKTEQGDSYLINVCGSISRTCNGQEASVCLTTQANKTYAIGRVNKTVLYDNGGLRFILHGEGCKSGRNSSTIVIFLHCRHGNNLGQPELYSKDEDCNFYYVWYTKAACPPYQFVDCTVMHDGHLYDLSQLTDSMGNHVVVKKQLHLMFLLNVCHSVVFGKDASCQYSSGACLVNLSNPDPTSRFSNIGDVGDGPYFEDGKLKLKYVGGEICHDPEGPDHTSTIITFECDHNMNYMPELLPGDVCVYELLWRTSAACSVNVTTEQPQEDDSCTVAVPGTDNRINLRPLRNKVKTVSDSAGHNYTFVVCGNLSSSPCGNSGVGVCQFKAQDQSQFWNAGVGNSHLHYSQGAISLEYTDGAPCNDKLKRSTRIDFVCELNGSERIVFIDEPDSCTYIISWYTDLACSRLVECSTPAWSDSEPVNLTPLIRLDHNYKVQAQNDTVLYINVCRPLLPVQGLNCGGSSACVARLHNGNLIDEKSLGFASGPVKGDKGEVFLMYLQGSECDSGPNYSSKFEFECDPKSGQGEPVFRNLTSDCQYQFLWKTSVTCQPFVKNVSVSDGHCIVNNEQMNASLDLKTLGQHGVMQVQEYSVNLCSSRTVTHISDNKSYGTLTSVEFDYQQKQVRLLFSMGANCTSTERYGSQLLLNCDKDAGSNDPRVLMENDCGVVIEWPNAHICKVLIPSSVHSTLHSEATHGSSVGLVVVLIVLVAVLCLLVLYFRKSANRSQLKSWVYSFLGTRHNGQFHYSRLEAADEASQLLVSYMDGQESGSDDELLRM